MGVTLPAGASPSETKAPAPARFSLDRIDLAGRPAPRPPLTRYTLERKLLVALRRRIRPENRLGGLVRKLREVCDVLLR